jgi:hypothetical protein
LRVKASLGFKVCGFGLRFEGIGFRVDSSGAHHSPPRLTRASRLCRPHARSTPLHVPRIPSNTWVVECVGFRG